MLDGNEEISSDSFDQWEDTGVKKEDVQSFVPNKRPPMAVLMVFDDGGVTGEYVRLRKDEFTIGRKQADLVIPHDAGIAETHVSIKRIGENGEYVWQLRDLSSTSGLFIRVRKINLCDSTEFLAGNHRYAFSAGLNALSNGRSQVQRRLEEGSIPGASVLSEPICYPSVRRIDEAGDGAAIWLIDGEYWIGTDLECSLRTENDPFLASKHVQIINENGSWRAQTHHVPNGMWLRVTQLDVKHTCTFQIGEQRLRLYVGPNFSRRS